MKITDNELKNQNRLLKKKDAALAQKIKMYRLLNWIKDDLHLRDLRKRLKSNTK